MKRTSSRNASGSATCLVLAGVLLLSWRATAASAVSRVLECPTADSSVVRATLYTPKGGGESGILLAPGAVFDAASWKPLAEKLAARGARVLALDYRAGTRSEAPAERVATLGLDVLAGVACLRQAGAQRISLVGASLGAIAVSSAASDPRVGKLERIALLSPPELVEPEKLPGRKLVIFSSHEPLAPRVRALYARLAPPKDLVALPGRAHAQHIFATSESRTLTEKLLAFLVPHTAAATPQRGG